MLLDVLRDVEVLESAFHSLLEAAFAFAVEPVAELLQQYERVRHHSRMLSLRRYRIEYLRHVRHVEVCAHAQVLRFPVGAAHEGMHIRKATLTGRRVPEVAHVYFSSVR